MQVLMRAFPPLVSGLVPRLAAGLIASVGAATAVAALLAQAPITITPGVQPQTPPALVRDFLRRRVRVPEIDLVDDRQDGHGDNHGK